MKIIKIMTDREDYHHFVIAEDIGRRYRICDKI